MGLNVGIIGLPNVGKSTIFNALTGSQNAEVANFPFCTIDPNIAVIPIPDERLHILQDILGVPNAIPATIEIVDIAGLVKGASEGEGLGNQFLGQVRNTDALLHIVRCFRDDNVVHIDGELNPEGDVETVTLELILSDIEQLNKKYHKLERQSKADKSILSLLKTAEEMLAHLNSGLPISKFPNKDSEFNLLNDELRLLTSKPIIFVANLGETLALENDRQYKALKEYADEQNIRCIPFRGKLEEEILNLPHDERHEFMELYNLAESGLVMIINTSFETLGLIQFYTHNKNEVRSWELLNGQNAQQAAGKIHSDMARGFIRAEVISYNNFIELGSEAEAKSAGLLKLEGKDYSVQDGDIILFRFNV